MMDDYPGTMTNDELADALCEMYPGECPDNDQILTWVHEIKERAWRFDQLRLYQGRTE